MAKKLSRAEKIRRYLTAHPDMALKDVAAHFDTTYQVVYMVRRGVRKREKFWAENGLPPAMTPMPEDRDGFVYRWIDTNQLDESAKDALVAQLAPIEQDMVNHPAHYKTGGIETIDFIEAKELNYNMGNAVKYISRAEHKGDKKQDLEKAIWYLNRELNKDL